jgi:hypothetical protein
MVALSSDILSVVDITYNLRLTTNYFKTGIPVCIYNNFYILTSKGWKKIQQLN